MADPTQLQIDPYSPPQIAQRAETVGVAKAQLSVLQLTMLGILAGSFIAIGAMFFLVPFSLLVQTAMICAMDTLPQSFQ